MTEPVHSIHILGSREFGGADQFFVRLTRALHRSGQPVTAICRPGSPVANALQHDSMERVHLPLANRWDAWSWWRIRQHIRADEPCVVQTYMGRATRLTRVPSKSPAVHVARLGGFYKIDGYYRHADAWVGNTRAICDFLVQSGLPARKVHHIGNFVPEPLQLTELEKADMRREHALSDDAWILFALGRMVPKKGFQDLLKAMALLPAEIGGRPLVLLLAGDGPERERLQLQAGETGIAHRVRFLGWQNPPDRFYELADVFVCPSRHEPLGNVILEAWNHSTPVISTRNEGASELIDDGVTGLLCERKDVKDMATIIRQTLEASEQNRLALAKAGQTRLRKRYSQTAIVETYLALYHALLKAKCLGFSD